MEMETINERTPPTPTSSPVSTTLSDQTQCLIYTTVSDSIPTVLLLILIQKYPFFFEVKRYKSQTHKHQLSSSIQWTPVKVSKDLSSHPY